jgi:hypothetical protein
MVLPPDGWQSGGYQNAMLHFISPQGFAIVAEAAVTFRCKLVGFFDGLTIALTRIHEVLGKPLKRSRPARNGHPARVCHWASL